ncbi:C-GCAxxG-C-C family protein [Sharpea porci]|uniref:C-GCAxxG-C-C family protein n=1 Tax=Sharpea porci TaxID=2652286 RepID=UPI002A91946D|nr:C-GCAxxG-C-C family protein [Sharpea porci]MDY5279503.1 C-GCAxxG-C-C family protein [Sharpea porci]
MSKYLDEAITLRARTDRHFNCAQAVLVPFAKGAGLDEELAFNLAANFGSGMKMAGTCGAITGGLMALGLYGVDDPATITQYYKRFRTAHQGMMNCGDLLKANFEKGLAKKPHCDHMVYEAIGYVEEILRERNMSD